MKAPKNKALIYLFFFLLLAYQNSYSQLIYNWSEYHIINNNTDNKSLEGHVLNSTKTTFKPTPLKSTDNVQLKNLCTNCSNQAWVIGLSNNIWSERPENEYYGYIKNKASGKYLTYDLTTGLVTQKVKLPFGSDQSQRWFVGNRFQLNQGNYAIKPYSDTSKSLTFKVATDGTTVPIIDVTAINWVIRPTKPVSITLQNIRNLCPSRNTKGDREFNGNGPKINLVITLSTQNNETEIWANINFKATETKSDWSTVEGIWDFRVFTSPDGRKIKDIIMDKVTYFDQTLSTGVGPQLIFDNNKTNNNYIDSLDKGVWSPVLNVKLVGDTGGDDISTDNNCDDDTRIEEINFRSLSVIFE
jgi:hypothetical protein